MLHLHKHASFLEDSGDVRQHKCNVGNVIGPCLTRSVTLESEADEREGGCASRSAPLRWQFARKPRGPVTDKITTPSVLSPRLQPAAQARSADEPLLPETRARGVSENASGASVRDVVETTPPHERATGKATGRASEAMPAKVSATSPATTAIAGAVKRGLGPTYDAGADAGRLYAAMKGGVTGLGTDEAGIHAVLRDKTPAQVQALRRAYADRYRGRSLDDDLASELSGKDEQRVRAALQGKSEVATAIGLEQAFDGLGADAAAVFSALEGKSPAELQKIRTAYQARNGRSLDEDLGRELNPDDAARARALLAHDPHQATAVSLHRAMAGIGTDEKTLFDTLERLSPKDRAAVEASYSKKYGTSLRAALAAELSGADLDLAHSLLDGDKAGAAAARLREALAGVGTDEAAIARALKGLSANERSQVQARYRQRYGETLDTALAADLSGQALADARTWVKQGRLSDVERVEKATRGLGTDETELRAVLAGKSAQEIAALDGEFRARNGGRSLRATIASETSGREQFDLEMALRGQVDLSSAAGLEEATKRARETLAFERSGLNNLLGRALTGIGGTGRILDESTVRVEQALARAQASGPALSDEEAARVRTLLSYQQDDVGQYRAAKDTAADAAGTGAAIVAGVAATVATAGAAAPLVVAAGAAAGSATKTVVGAAVRGEVREETALQDLRSGAVDGLASAVTGLAAKGIGSAVAKTMNTSESALGHVGLLRGSSAGGSTTQATAATSSRGLVGTTVERSLTGAGRGGVSGGTSGAATAAVDPNTYQGSLTSALSAIAVGATQGARTGIVGALDPTAAVAGTTVGRLAPRIDQATNAALSKVGVNVSAAAEGATRAGALGQAAVTFAVETPKKALEGAAAASLGALLAGDVESVVHSVTDAAAQRTAGSVKDAAVATTKNTVERRLRR
jgi:hypothetical protein